MKIYSNGKDRVLKGDFPSRFKLLNAGVEVPYIRTGKQSVRLSGDIPFGELDVEEIVRKKVPQPAKLDAESVAIINKKDFDQIDILSKKLTINQEQMNNHLSALTEQEATLSNLETQNAQAIDQTNLNMVEMAKAFGKEIQADRDALVATSSGIKQVISETAEVLDAKLQAHEVAKNPHKITKETVGLGAVDNTSDMDKPVSKATQKALDKKADKSDIENLDKRLLESDKKQDTLMRNLETVNLYGGVGGNELPSGGKKGQILSKKSSKTGDYSWIDNPVINVHNDLSGRDASDAHPISAITGLQDALDEKQPTISDIDTIRSNALAGKDASDTIATYGDIVTHDTNEFATEEQGALADTAIQPNDNISELNNDAGYITKDVNDLTNYTLTSSLGSAAFTPSSDYATSAQGAKADTAIQPSDLGTAAYASTTDFATSAQGAKADSALQPNSPITGATKCKITYDSNGLVTSGADLEASDIPSLTISKISDITATASELNVLDGITASTTELNYLDGVTSSIQTQLNGKQPTGNYVTTDTIQTINQAATKTFNGRVNFIGAGDANAIYLSTDTRIDVYGTSRTVLGFATGTFLINNAAYPLNLRGSGARPAWNGTSYLALTSDIGNATLTIQKNGTAVDTFSANATSDKTINITVPTNNNELTNGAGYQTSSDVASAISVETTNRENADIGLQQQIDAITASSDVKDIVGTYAQLQAYDTSTLGNNDIIKVLQDETHDNETTYYRWSTTTETFTLIGEEGPYYTKSEADSTFVPQTRTVNNKALSSNITLTASDVGALPDSTVIPTVNNATLTIQKNGTSVATFTANSSTNATANITVPTDTGDLTNGAGFITGITSSDVTTALGYTPYDDSNPDGYITGITSGDVTTALGYTPYNSSNPNGYQANVIETVKVNGTSLTPSSKAVDITVPTNNNQLTNGAGYITSSALTGYATETWVGQQGYLTSTALNGYATQQWVGQQGFITGITSSDVTTALGYSPVNPSSLATVATSGSYNDLSNKPTIPTVNNPTITITQGGVTKGSFTLNQSTGDTIALDAGGGGNVNTFDLFDHKWSDYQLNDQSWLRADTFSWQDGTVYSDAYSHLVADYQGGTSTTETVGSYTITYVLATDGHKITTDETNVANIYNESGVAWYYVLDTANQRFKLPRELPITDKSKGNGITLGLTDGTKNSGLMATNLNNSYNVGNYENHYGVTVGTTAGIYSTNSNKTLGITTDPTKSGIISHRANENGKQYLYFYVGQFSQTATEQTAGLNSELFNGKADTDLSNVSSNIDYVVDSYQSGNDWYRLYKSGWVEQGGFSSGDNWRTVNLLKTMADTNYDIQLTGQTTERNGSYGLVQVTSNLSVKTTSSIYISGWGLGVTNGGIYWKVCGKT